MEVKKVQPERFDPTQLKKTDKDGFDEDGVLHDQCGTPDCCRKCDTADEGVSDDTT